MPAAAAASRSIWLTPTPKLAISRPKPLAPAEIISLPILSETVGAIASWLAKPAAISAAESGVSPSLNVGEKCWESAASASAGQRRVTKIVGLSCFVIEAFCAKTSRKNSVFLKHAARYKNLVQCQRQPTMAAN